MSELINNREHRQKVLKELIMELHDGKSVEEVRGRFAKLIEGVSTQEITEMEQNLVAEGMPIKEIQRLCDVHAAVFKGSIAEIHSNLKVEETPGHPIQTFKLENRAIEDYIKNVAKPNLEKFINSHDEKVKTDLEGNVKSLREIDKHYSRKENLLFPFLEKAGITAPPKVMWGVDDEIREALKELEADFGTKSPSGDIVQRLKDVFARIGEMIFKEENILFPMAIETLSRDEWIAIADDSDEIGYSFIKPQPKWLPEKGAENKEAFGETEKGAVSFETGVLKTAELEAMLNHLPIDITFIDKDDVVKYFSQGQERIFARTKTVIGRDVGNCHPPASVHIVENLLEDFKVGKKDSEDFWLRRGDLFVFIRYFAVRDKNGEYMGTLEVTQNIAPIQAISGEKRLVSDEK